jgi:hypothetical protein
VPLAGCCEESMRAPHFLVIGQKIVLSFGCVAPRRYIDGHISEKVTASIFRIDEDDRQQIPSKRW